MTGLQNARPTRQSLYSFQHDEASCVFSFEDLGFTSVRWSIDFVDSLQEEIVRSSFEGDRVKEIGGILFGTREAGEQEPRPKPQVTVSWFLPMPLEALVQNEGSVSETISEKIAAAQESGLSVVGLYKTRLKLAPELSTRDHTLAEQLLTDSGQFLLSVFPSGPLGSTAELFFPRVEDSGEGLAVTFPFDRKALSHSRAVPPVRRRIPVLALAAAGVVGAGLFLAGVLYRGTGKVVKSAIAPPSFGLQAFSEGDHVNVTWNENAKPIDEAAYGVLAVQDGAVKRQIFLDRSSLKKGFTAYYPSTKQVKFRLEVGEGNAEIAVEAKPQKRAAAKPVALPVSAKVSAPQSKPPEVKTPEVKPLGVKLTGVTPPGIKPPAVKPTQVKQEEPRSRSKPEEALRQIKPEQPRPQFTPLEPRAGRIATVRPSALPAPPLEVAQIVSKAQPAPDLPIVTAPSLPTPSVPSPVVSAPPGAVPARVLFVAAESDKRVFPHAPPNIGRLLTSPVTIRVKVRVSERGDVMRVESLDRGNPVANYLSRLSEDAARLWHFVPAKRNNLPAASETVLEFRFTGHENPSPPLSRE